MKKLFKINSGIFVLVCVAVSLFLVTTEPKFVNSSLIFIGAYVGIAQGFVLMVLWAINRVLGNVPTASCFSRLGAFFIWIAFVIFDIGFFIPRRPELMSGDYLGLTTIIPWTILVVIIVTGFPLFRSLTRT